MISYVSVADPPSPLPQAQGYGETSLLPRPSPFPFSIPGRWVVYKPDFLFRWFRRHHELTNGLKDILDLFIVPFQAFF